VIHFVGLPLLVVLAVALLGGPTLDRLAPAVAAFVNVVILLAVVVAAVPTFWVLGLSALSHAGVRHALSNWSMHLLPDQPVTSALIGAASVVLAVVGLVRVVTVVRRHRLLRCADGCAVEIVDTPAVFAYTLPGPAGTIAVSRGLRETLTDAEFDIVIAHEESHARHRHDRFLLLALVVDAAVPFMRRATAQLRFHLERWADEDAVRTAATDRSTVARTIAKVALATTPNPAALGIATHGVAARASALMEPPSSAGATRLALIAGIVTTTVALSITQIHHTAVFMMHAIV
jgi:Zn-dependent protease with chaperone function